MIHWNTPFLVHFNKVWKLWHVPGHFPLKISIGYQREADIGKMAVLNNSD